jgi:hypothetical protein
LSSKTITRIIVLSTIIVALTPLFIPVTVTHPGQLRDLRFGTPMPFVQQDYSLTPPDNWFPHRLTVLSPWENPTRILWGNFFASVALIAITLVVLGMVLRELFEEGLNTGKPFKC